MISIQIKFKKYYIKYIWSIRMTNKTYMNPVRRGFFPDPSVLRVGEDYYMVNSTFQYFPGVIISHSKDLVHWETIGHAITEKEYMDISDILDSHGIWAPDISYYNSKYYIFAPLRLNNPPEGVITPVIKRKQLVMTSDRPEGPYSKPWVLDADGIDPSHFVDDDGTHYMVVSMVAAPGANLCQLSEDCKTIVRGPEQVWQGTGRRKPEGPHIMKKDGYYYVILAEGGTGHGHCITTARSKNIWGPYEECPYNPVMAQTNPDAKIQRAGHGKLVQTQNGEWWITYLCSRRNEGNYTTLGRETALDPVKWTDDGWFIVNDLKGPSEIQKVPNLVEYAYEEKNFDDFEGIRLSFEWEFVRNPDNSSWSLSERPGYFRIWTGNYDLCDIRAKNTLLRRETEHCYAASLKLEFDPKQGEEAGLTCYYGFANYAKIFLTFDNGLKVKIVENRNTEIKTLGEFKANSNVIYFKIETEHQKRRFFFSEDDQNWALAGSIENATFLCDEGVLLGKHFTGTLVGMYANNGGNGNKINADFDWFNYK